MTLTYREDLPPVMNRRGFAEQASFTFSDDAFDRIAGRPWNTPLRDLDSVEVGYSLRAAPEGLSR